MLKKKFSELLLGLGCQVSNDVVNVSNKYQRNDNKNDSKILTIDNDDYENEIVSKDIIVKPSNITNGIRKNISIPIVVIDTSPTKDININDDLLLYLSNINVVKDNNTMIYEYYYNTNAYISNNTNNTLIQVLHNVIHNSNSNSSSNNSSNAINVKDITIAIDYCIEIISSKFILGLTTQLHNESSLSSPSSSSPISNYSNNTLTLDNIVILLDILQSSIIILIQSLISSSASSSSSSSSNNNNNNNNNINDNINITLYKSLERLFSNYGEVATSISYCTDIKSKEIWCQCIKKSSHIIILLFEINLIIIKNINDIKKGNNLIHNIINIVSLLQSLAPTNMITITISDINIKIFSVLNYWSACCHAITNLELFLKYCTRNGQLEENPRSSHEYQLKTIVTSIIGRIINSLAQANFNPKELYAEICRMKHGRNHNIDSIIINNTNNDNDNDDDDFIHLDPYQIRYILFGLHKMLQVKSFASRILKNPNTLKLPRTIEWMTSIAESLMLCISYGPLKVKGESAYDDNEDHIGKIPLKLAPFLAQLLFQLCSNCDDYANVDWIFIELSRYLSLFTDFLRRIRKFSKTARYLHASSASSLPSVGSFESSNIDDQPMLGDSYDSCSFYSLANPINLSKGRSPRTESSSPLFIEKEKPKFAVGDLVDGYCSTQNGSYRWFPGTIKSMNNNDRTYTVLYKDGDEHKDKKESELRPSKRIGSKSRNGSSGPNAHVPPVPKLGIGSARNITTQDSPQRTETSSPTGITERSKKDRSPFLSTPDFNISPMTKYDDIKNTDYGFRLNLPIAKEKNEDDPLASPKSILSDDSDNNIFEIPSVFKDTERSDRSVSFVKNKDIVPRMQFEDLNMSGSFQMPNSSQSLSSDLFGGILNNSSEKQFSEKKANSSRSVDIHYQGTDRSKDDGGSSATRLLSWRDESSRLSGQSTSRLGLLMPRPIQAGPSAEMISSQEAIQRLKIGGQVASSARSGKSINSCRIPISLSESYEDLDDQTLSVFFETLSIISAILINRSISNSSLLQYSCCISRETAEFATNPNGERKKVLSNILFSVRDFLDVTSSSESKNVIGLLTSMCNMTNRAMMRLLKLSTPILFQSCFIKHSEKGARIGQGGFGTINKVFCDCAVLDICQQCNWSREKESTIKQCQRLVAIKRVGRERSAFDNPMFYDIFQEISCLEILSSSSFNGVCKLIDYGIVHAEYWMVMECGKYNLKEWRSQHLIKHSNASDHMLSNLELRQCLVYFLDALLIIQHVHIKDIAHFDIKCENFIVRPNDEKISMESSIEQVFDAYSKGSCSGHIFIADFGESVYQESSVSSDKPFKSRGTLTIQSPEMIALTERTDNTRKGQKVFTRPNKKSDIWSLGCMLYELLTGEYLFYEKSWPELFVTLCMDKMAPMSFDGLHKVISSSVIRLEIESLLRDILKQDAEGRMAIKDIMIDLYDLIQKLDDSKGEKNVITYDNDKVPTIDITISSHEQLSLSLLKSISTTVSLHKNALDCSNQKLYLHLKSKYETSGGLANNNDSLPDKVINKLVKVSSLTNVADILVLEKLTNIYANSESYYEVDILINHDGVAMDNQLHITRNSFVLIENINVILSNCMANMKQGKVITINLYSSIVDKNNTNDLDQYSIIQITVAICLIEFLSNYGIDKLSFIGECNGHNKIQSISPWIYEHCNYEILNFIFANITL